MDLFKEVHCEANQVDTRLSTGLHVKVLRLSKTRLTGQAEEGVR